MMQRNYWIASGLATTGVAVISCTAAPDFIRRYLPIPEIVFAIGIYLGALFLLAAGILAIYEKVREFTPETDYIARKITKHDLGELYRFLKNFLGDDILSLNRMKAFHAKNPDIFFGVFEESNAMLGGRARRLCGHYSIAPVTPETRSLLEKSSLKGSDFGPENITEKTHKAAGLYIGSVVAHGRQARAATVLALISRLQIEAERKSPHVFTRPVSNDGLRLAKRNQFEPVVPNVVPPLNIIHYRDFTDKDPE